MSETIASEIWTELKRYINTVDRAEAADIMVSILVDNDSDIDDIRSAFKGDADIKRALNDYVGADKADEEDEEGLDYEDDDIDEDWEN